MWFSSCVLASSDFGGGAVTMGTGGGGAAQAARPARAAQAARMRRLFDIVESFPFAADTTSRLSRKNAIRSTPFQRLSIGRRALGEAGSLAARQACCAQAWPSTRLRGNRDEPASPRARAKFAALRDRPRCAAPSRKGTGRRRDAQPRPRHRAGRPPSHHGVWTPTQARERVRQIRFAADNGKDPAAEKLALTVHNSRRDGPGLWAEIVVCWLAGSVSTCFKSMIHGNPLRKCVKFSKSSTVKTTEQTQTYYV